MYRKTKRETQLDAFSGIPNLLIGSSFDQYNDTNNWNNQFRSQVLSRIEEDNFSILFSSKMGAPNSSISILIGMMILKESFGWSDSQLFERCRFDLLVRSSLGLFNMSDSVPAESTYYLLRKRINEYRNETGIDLIEKVFEKITKGQIVEFQVSGRSIRMDSKLISSNIAFYSRYEIVHQTLALFCKKLDNRIVKLLSTQDVGLIKELQKEKGNKVVYRNNKDEIVHRMQSLGELAYKLLAISNQSKSQYYQTLQRVFSEHYRVIGEDKIELLPKEEIKANSVQSPHDTECGYRKKDDKPVKGYSYNITETCDNDELSLITNLQVEDANTADNDFVQPSIEQTKELLGHQVENLHTDGAYNSQSNQEYTQKENINFYLTGLQGATGRFDLNLTENGLKVTDMQTNETQIAIVTKNKKWRIKVNNKYRYFTQKEIDSCQLRKIIEQIPAEKKKIRNNIEATIFQASFYTRNNKTKYRGKIKQKMWVTLRCIWINLVRIMNYLKRQWTNHAAKAGNVLKIDIVTLIYSIKNISGAYYRTLTLKHFYLLNILSKNHF